MINTELREKQNELNELFVKVSAVEQQQEALTKKQNQLFKLCEIKNAELEAIKLKKAQQECELQAALNK
jgi:hypothetical protein